MIAVSSASLCDDGDDAEGTRSTAMAGPGSCQLRTAAPKCAEVGARVDGDAQRDVRRKQSRALGAEAFEPFMPEGDRELTLAADPREIGEESSEQRVARRRFETRQERCRGCHLLHLMARPRSLYCTPPDEGDLDRFEVGEAAQPKILMLADAGSQRA